MMSDILKPKTVDDVKKNFNDKHNITHRELEDFLRYIKHLSLFDIKTFWGKVTFFVLFLILGSLFAMIGELISHSFPITAVFLYVGAGLAFGGGCLVPFLVAMDM
jgi:hypothetical protein